MRHSTSKPTAEEAAWIVACKEGPCIACLVRTGERYLGCDFHHLISGSRRRGHMFGIALCKWHHLGHPYPDCPPADMRKLFGPSLMDGSKLFHAEYGSDDELLELQRKVLSD